MANRLLTILTFPLSPREKMKLRTIYKGELNLPKNANESKMAITFGIDIQELYPVMVNSYNDYAEAFNTKLLMKRTNDKKEKARLKKTETFIKNNVGVYTAEWCGDNFKLNFRQVLLNHIGESIIVEYRNGDEVFMKTEYQVPTTFSSWWHRISLNDWGEGSNYNTFEYHDFQGKVYIYKQGLNITTDKIKQVFRDGITHCVFTPIRNWASEKLEGAESTRTKERYRTVLKRIEKLEETYSLGVPEDAISQICNSLQIDIQIEMPLSETKFIDVQSIKKRLKQFRFMNTRINHIELNEITLQDTPMTVSRERLYEIKNELDKHTKYYTWNTDKNGVASIKTLTACYSISNEYGEIVNSFEKETGLNFCKLDDVGDKELCDFIQEGMNYNGTVDFQDVRDYTDEDGNIDDRVYHVDMEKAYSKFKTSEYYEGFLGKITDFRKTDKVQGVGLYKITNIQFGHCDKAFMSYMRTMNIYIDNNVYTSCELKMLTENNVTYDIVCGCWGVSPIDFDFTHDMLTKKDEGIPYYSKWSGANDSHRLEKTFWIKGNDEYANAITSHIGDGNLDTSQRTVRWYKNGEICIATKKKHNFHLAHITAFITAYQRLNVLSQLKVMDHNKIIRVCVDGIYYLKHDFNQVGAFRLKMDKMTFGNQCGNSYISVAHTKDLVINGYDSRNHYKTELHLGEGGCGKTHYNCNDKGLIKPMFIAPSWKLARAKKNEIGISSTVWARAITDDPERVNIIKSLANTLIIDEVSMLTEEQKKQFFNIYGDMKIIMCGDLGYQLPCITGTEMNSQGFENIQRHTTDFRCQCPQLKGIKNALRRMIETECPKALINRWVVAEFKRLNRIIEVNKLQQMYKVEDMILTGTNELKDYYTKLFPTLEKYYVSENNRLHCNGDIVIGPKPEGTECNLQHAFTTHSIQGETATHNLYIDSSRMFDSRMFYTAISRAKTLEQIYIIDSSDIKIECTKAIIYKIVSKSGVYIGSSTCNIEKRFKEHKQSYKTYLKNGGKYVTSYALLGDDDVKIELVEQFNVIDKKELLKKEAEYINTISCVNKTFKNDKSRCGEFL